MQAMKWPRWLILAAMAALTGCARYPSTPVPPTAPARQLIVDLTVAGQINSQYYYFLALDTDGGPTDGPVPIVAGPDWGNGWGVISDSIDPPPDYVMCHQGIYQQIHDNAYIGAPYQASVSADGTTIHLALDLDAVSTTATTLDVNLICTDSVSAPMEGLFKTYDALGESGNDFITIPIDVSGIYSNSNSALTESEGDCEDSDLDLVDWRVEVLLD